VALVNLLYLAHGWRVLMVSLELGAYSSFRLHVKTGGSTSQTSGSAVAQEQSSGFVLKDSNFGDKYVTSIYRLVPTGNVAAAWE